MNDLTQYGEMFYNENENQNYRSKILYKINPLDGAIHHIAFIPDWHGTEPSIFLSKY